MTTRILAIMGSPHQGNSLEITQRIEQKLVQLGDVDFEYIHLKDVDLRPSLKYLKDIAGGLGFDCVDQFGYLAAPKNTPLRTIATRKDRTDEVVHKFYQAIVEKRPRKLTFTDHLGFRLMQASYARLETMSPTDYQHWKERGWLEKETQYFYGNVKRNVFMDLIARFIGWMTGRQIDKALAEIA